MVDPLVRVRDTTAGSPNRKVGHLEIMEETYDFYHLGNTFLYFFGTPIHPYTVISMNYIT